RKPIAAGPQRFLGEEDMRVGVLALQRSLEAGGERGVLGIVAQEPPAHAGPYFQCGRNRQMSEIPRSHPSAKLRCDTANINPTRRGAIQGRRTHRPSYSLVTVERIQQ